MSVLKGTKNFYAYEVSDTLSQNLKTWIEYGLLEIGAYTAISRSGANSGYSQLQRVYDDRYGGNRVFEGVGPGWVWESGVSTSAGSDTIFGVSGVFVGATYLPNATSGSNSYIIDYANGRIVFDNAVSTASGVSCDYVTRDVAVYLSDSVQWKTIVQKYEERFDDIDNLSPSGMASILKENRIWLPCIVVEVQDRTNRPLQLGGGDYNEFAVFYHIFSETAFPVRRIVDMLNNQEGKRLDLYNLATAPFPLNRNGTIASGSLTYPNLSSRNGPYFWTYAYIESSRGGYRNTFTDLHRGEIIQSIAVGRYLSTL